MNFMPWSPQILRIWHFQQKSVARMNSIRVGYFRCSHDVCHVQVTVGTGRFSDTNSLIGKLHVGYLYLPLSKQLPF